MIKMLDMIEKLLDAAIEKENKKIESWDAKQFIFDESL
mgnify:FL=1|tara:strand:+ start:585 stop:698 length:114 start_codon:yes stop_codon:yes gene_type:complete